MNMNEPVLCPWCGSEMSLDTAINRINPSKFSGKAECVYKCYACGATAPRTGWKIAKEAPEAAYAAAMKRAEPPNSVLTLEEVRARNHKPVYVVGKEKVIDGAAGEGWSIVDAEVCETLYVIYDFCDYGKEWVAFDCEPTDEERAAVPWGDKEA